MKSTISIAAAVLFVPAVSFAQQYTTTPASGSEVRAGMEQLQKGGYNANFEGATYPEKLQAVNARLYPQYPQKNYVTADTRANMRMTRDQVKTELAQLLQTGYSPFNAGETAYPTRFLAAQARLRAQQYGIPAMRTQGMYVEPVQQKPVDGNQY